MSDIKNPLNDHNYLDITIRGNPNITDPLVLANYRETRTAPLLLVPSEWEMGIIRFSVPSNNIPLFFYNTSQFLIRLVDNTGVPVAYTTNVISFNSGIFNPYTPPPNTFTIFTYSQFIDGINVTLTNLFNQLKTANPGFPGVNPPLLQYNSATKIISLYAETPIWHPGGGGSGQIYFSSSLFKYFLGLPSFSSGLQPGFVGLSVFDQVGNTITYLGQPTNIMASDFQDVLNWDQVSQVIVKTTSVPIIPEQKAVGNNQNAVFQSILTDFNFAGTGFREAGRLAFYNQGNIRFYDMISDHPLTQFDLTFEFSDLAGNTFPIYISPGDSANIKVIFKKKGIEITN